MLVQIADDLFCAESDLWMPGRVHFDLRMMVIRLPDGSLLLHSPIAIDDELAAAIAELGRVGHIVAPCGFHHLFVAAAAERYPDARTYASPAVLAKRPGLTVHETLTDQAPDAWREVIDQTIVRGAPKIDEVVFFHRPSRTLIVTDLVFHMLRRRGWGTRLLFRLVGVSGRLAQSRVWRLFTRDRAAAGASVKHILGWDFDRLVMAHGEIVEQGGRDALEAALWWMLGTAPRQAAERLVSGSNQLN